MNPVLNPALNPVLFLDFDGVAHPEVCTAEQLFCCLPVLEEVLRRRPGVDIVISSAWREHHSLQELQGHFSPELRGRVVGCTPLYKQDKCEPAQRYVREIECRTWLQTHRPQVLEIGAWLAVDDNPWLFSPGCPHLLMTAHWRGFAPADAEFLERRLDEVLQQMQQLLQQNAGLQQRNSSVPQQHKTA